jgi:hypothetical protein
MVADYTSNIDLYLYLDSLPRPNFGALKLASFRESVASIYRARSEAARVTFLASRPGRRPPAVQPSRKLRAGRACGASGRARVLL